MNFKIIVLIILTFCLITSCINIEKEKKTTQIGQTEISIPIDSLVCLQPAGNNFIDNHVANADYKYVIYCDSTACSMCELERMGIWNGIIKKAKSAGVTVDFMFIFNPPKKDVTEFINGYYSNRYSLTVFIDTIGIIEKNNTLLKKLALHSFILNENNHIVKIGDASKNAGVEQAFYKFLKNSKKDSAE